MSKIHCYGDGSHVSYCHGSSIATSTSIQTVFSHLISIAVCFTGSQVTAAVEIHTTSLGKRWPKHFESAINFGPSAYPSALR